MILAEKPAADSAGSARSATHATPAHNDVDVARAKLYLLLANLFARAPSGQLLRDVASIKGDATPLGMALAALAHTAHGAERDTVAREYFSIFVGVGRGDVLPYASYYLTGFLNERPLARVREDMARLGIERRVGTFEPEDHIASLLEVMAGIIGGELERPAAEADQFFARHIAPWAGRLMADVSAAPNARFYRHVGDLGRVWLELEQAAMQLSGSGVPHTAGA
jgi:TorA maturation chaperone TorD